jgi:uncharacterized caspase-like protein
MAKLAALIIALACVLLTNTAEAAKRLALVIGIDAYREVPALQKAVGDAGAIADKLAGLGFDVRKVIDADRRALNVELANFYGRISPGDTVLVHFSGHGVEIGGQNYLLPADIPLPESGQTDLLKSEALSLSTLVETLGDKGAAVRLLIIDACRDNPFARSGKRSLGTARGLASIEPTKGTFIMYSAAAGQAALDRLGDSDTQPTSVYTRVLLQWMDKPGLPLRDLAASVREDVENLSKSVGHEQRPAYYDDLPRDFAFAPSSGGTSEPPPAQPPATGITEQQAYAMAQSIDTPAGWDAFLAQYPNGAFAAFARAAREKSLAALAPPPASEPPPPADTRDVGGFIFPDSDRRLLKAGELAGLSKSELRIARNEIYARHGRKFVDAKLRAYFSQFAWYRPRYKDVQLNDIEQRNVSLIQSYE